MTRNPREDLKKFVTQLKSAQQRFASKINKEIVIDKARTYAEKQMNKYQGLLKKDLGRLQSFAEKEVREFQKLRNQVPAELKRIQTYVMKQRGELDKIIKSIRTAAVEGKKKTSAKAPRKRSTTKSSKRTTSAGARARS